MKPTTLVLLILLAWGLVFAVCLCVPPPIADKDDDENDDATEDDDTWSDDDSVDDDSDPADCPEGYPTEPACTDTTEVGGKTWTVCDSGSDITFYCAKKYAESLALDGITDWRLPTMAELWTLFDRTGSQTTECSGFSVPIKPPFDLSCTDVWSDKSDGKHAWYFDFWWGGEGTKLFTDGYRSRALTVYSSSADDDTSDDDDA